MIIGVERLFEAITGPEWEMNEATGELVKYNSDRTRKLSYVGWDGGDSDVFATMKMSFLDNDNQWEDVVNLRHYSFRDEERVVIVAMAMGKDGQPVNFRYSKSGMYFYYNERWGLSSYRRVLEDRQELLLSEDEMPKEIDLILTANLLVDQFVRGEMDRPVLVPF